MTATLSFVEAKPPNEFAEFLESHISVGSPTEHPD